ncbi:MAG TPA: FdhF/YdeP family oxidoreductase [Steroidobacteraceae bacterium]|nr:FdhF/YdeP family oxidoreductase [Steroidobacteraceae bacterium]
MTLDEHAGTPDDVDEREQGPSGGWGSAHATASILWQEHAMLRGSRVIAHQNKPHGYACVSCSWAKPEHPHAIEACESGIKATAWEITSRRTPPEFFEEHTVAELLTWSDHELEEQGRLTAPLKWDARSDRYLPVDWEEAFAAIGRQLRELDPRSVVFYTSGRASLETAFLYQLCARLYGSTNLPDSSNMCHESTSVALPMTIGVPIGTVTLEDFTQTDCIFFFGQNVGTNSPRMLHQLQDARKRGVPIVTFNPLRERGLVSFVNPLSPVEMLTGKETVISTQYHQVRIGGDIAAITGVCKALIAADEAAQAAGEPRVLDVDFIAEHTHGFEEFRDFVAGCSWTLIEQRSGLSREALEAAAAQYARAQRVMGIYGMGLTQHRRGVENVQMVSNLLLLRGNIGKPGAGICPVRGHSNVQGQRTVGITEKPDLVPNDTLKARYGFEPPLHKGLNTVETCKGVLAGSVRAFIGLGGNFVRAVPETALLEKAWSNLSLTVQIATKLNRSHLVHGRESYLLPCLGRIEVDRQQGGAQAVTMEDSTGCMHGSRGVAEPAAATLRSEPAIVAGIAKATLEANPAVEWDRWIGDYALVRDEIAAIYPDIFHDLNQRMWTPGGFRRPVAAAHRQWKTSTGKANFIAPQGLDEDPDMPAGDATVLRLMTMRSDDQFNTSIYTLNDRFRGIRGSRKVLFMNRDDATRLGFQLGDMVVASTVTTDGVDRSVSDLRIVGYDIPSGCVAGYFPECNPLIPLWHHAEKSFVPAAKSIPIRLRLSRATAPAP